MASPASSTIRRPITAPSWPRTCARCSIIWGSAAPTSWVIRWGRVTRLFWRWRIRSGCVRRCLAVLASVLIEGVGDPETIAQALEAPTLADVSDPTGRMFRAFAEKTRSDLRALAACIRGARQTLSRRRCWPHRRAGAGRGRKYRHRRRLAGRACRAHSAVRRRWSSPGRDHMLAVGDRVFKGARGGLFAWAALTGY